MLQTFSRGNDVIVICIVVILLILVDSVVSPRDLQSVLLHVGVLSSIVVVQISYQVSERLLASTCLTVAVSPDSLEVILQKAQIDLGRCEVTSLIASVGYTKLEDIVVSTSPTPLQNVRSRSTILVNITNDNAISLFTSGVHQSEIVSWTCRLSFNQIPLPTSKQRQIEVTVYVCIDETSIARIVLTSTDLLVSSPLNTISSIKTLRERTSLSSNTIVEDQHLRLDTGDVDRTKHVVVSTRKLYAGNELCKSLDEPKLELTNLFLDCINIKLKNFDVVSV